MSARALLAVTESAGEVMIEARETGARARVRLQPFAVEVFAPGSGSIPSAVFNKRGGFAMELAREESGEW